MNDCISHTSTVCGFVFLSGNLKKLLQWYSYRYSQVHVLVFVLLGSLTQSLFSLNVRKLDQVAGTSYDTRAGFGFSTTINFNSKCISVAVH